MVLSCFSKNLKYPCRSRSHRIVSWSGTRKNGPEKTENLENGTGPRKIFLIDQETKIFDGTGTILRDIF